MPFLLQHLSVLTREAFPILPVPVTYVMIHIRIDELTVCYSVAALQAL